MYMTMFMFFMHDIVVLSTCCECMHGMSLYDMVLPYTHNVGLIDHMMKVLLCIQEVVYTCLIDV